MGLIDRYVVRQLIPPFLLGLLIFTFVLIIEPLRDYAEELIAQGVSSLTVAQLIFYLLPQSLAMTIPMALLLALLVGFGRLSADREFVAMQACGVSLVRLLRPVVILSFLAWAATSYMWFWGMPHGNQAFREVVFDVIADRAAGEVKPRLFFTTFPRLTIYVRDIPRSGIGWEGVFLYDQRQDPPSVFLARRGRVIVNRADRKVELVLEDGARHGLDAEGHYDLNGFEQIVLNLDPESIFRDGTGPTKDIREKTLPELLEDVRAQEAKGGSTHNQWINIHWKFAIPVASFIFGIVGVALGATNRRDGAAGSFVIGVFVVLFYWVPLVLGEAMVKGGNVPPWFAAWLPNLLVGTVGLLLFMWRRRSADRPIRIPLPKPRKTVRSIPGLKLIDLYVTGTYLRVLFLTLGSLLLLSYIAAFIDHSDKLFKGTATLTMMADFMANQTPQFIYWTLPLGVLLAALVTVALLTKNSELIVMKACGISLYRLTAPMLFTAVVGASLLFVMEETVLGPANRRAELLRHVMNGGRPETFAQIFRQWVVGNNGDIYHFNGYDPARQEMHQATIYTFGDGMARLTRRTYAERIRFIGDQPGRPTDAWEVQQGWTREFDTRSDLKPRFAPFERVEARLDPVTLFSTEEPDPRFMGYATLRDYLAQLESTGVDVTELRVGLARKIAFPFVTLVMTLIGVPFAVTIGRSGAMAGIGVGIALAVVYIIAGSVFAALGGGGALDPRLAAWAPNLLFGTGAVYLLLTVRT
jgi:LPS export ABC transporter permease LptF/LPS export ABC transporter permease LptG